MASASALVQAMPAKFVPRLKVTLALLDRPIVLLPTAIVLAMALRPTLLVGLVEPAVSVEVKAVLLEKAVPTVLTVELFAVASMSASLATAIGEVPMCSVALVVVASAMVLRPTAVVVSPALRLMVTLVSAPPIMSLLLSAVSVFVGVPATWMLALEMPLTPIAPVMS